MTDRKTELLAAIRASDDDHAKLVYADWLEDHGDVARANLIRLQCRAAALPPWDREAVAAQWEIEQILVDHGDRFRAELPELPGITWTDFAKGFVYSIKLDRAEALVGHEDEIAAASPVTRVEVESLVEAEASRPVPWLRTLRMPIDGANHRIDPTSSLLSQARELELHDVSYDMFDLLSLRDVNAPLARLTVEGEHTDGARLVRRLVELPGAKHLKHLAIGTAFVDYDSGYYEDPTLRFENTQILARGGFNPLEVLDVSRQRITSDGLALVVDAMPRLRELGARACELEHLEFLARSTGEPFVRLDLGENALGDANVRALVSAPRAARLEVLALDTTELYSGGVTAIVESPCWSTLRVLDLGRNPLGVAGALSLAGARHPAHLHTLRLANCDLTTEAARILGEVSWLGQLASVDLSKNLVDPVLVAALAGVRELRLSYVPGTGLALALAPIWAQAVHVDLGGTLNVELPLAAPELFSLALEDCKLDNAAIDRLAAGGYPRLRRLALGKNAFDDAALARLLASPLARQLESLSLARAGLGTAAAEVIAGTAFERLKTLDLRGNAFEASALVTIARSPTLARVPSLRLSGQPWTFPDAEREELAARFGEGWYYGSNAADDDDAADDE